MKAKILTSIHSGIKPGTIGEIIEELGGGCAIEVDVHRTSLFGGGDVSDKAVMYFGNNEFERLPEIETEEPIVDEQSSPQINVTVIITEHDVTTKLHLPEGEELPPGEYFATLAKVEDNR